MAKQTCWPTSTLLSTPGGHSICNSNWFDHTLPVTSQKTHGIRLHWYEPAMDFGLYWSQSSDYPLDEELVQSFDLFSIIVLLCPAPPAGSVAQPFLRITINTFHSVFSSTARQPTTLHYHGYPTRRICPQRLLILTLYGVIRKTIDFSGCCTD